MKDKDDAYLIFIIIMLIIIVGFVGFEVIITMIYSGTPIKDIPQWATWFVLPTA